MDLLLYTLQTKTENPDYVTALVFTNAEIYSMCIILQLPLSIFMCV